MIDRRSFFTTAIGAAAWLAGRKPAGHAVAVGAPLPEAAPTVGRSRQWPIEREIERRTECYISPPFPGPSAYDPDVLICEGLHVRCCVSDELLADSDIVRAEVERRMTEALLKQIDSSWGAVAGSDEVAEVYPFRKFRDEASRTVSITRGALRLKLKPNKTYYPPHGHALRPIGWHGCPPRWTTK